MYDISQTKHLSSIKKLEEPALLRIEKEYKPEITTDIQRYLDNLACMQERYKKLPNAALTWMRKLRSYRKATPIRLLRHIFGFFFLVDLALLGRKDAYNYLGKGLTFAQDIKKADAASLRKGNVTDFGSGFGYDSEQHDLAIALRYKAWTDAASHFETEEERMGTEFYFGIKNTEKFIASTKGIKKFLNFGACYGYMENELASRLPNIHVIGLDRAKLVKEFNDNEFSQPNLEYVADDILNFIESQDTLDDCAFMMMRTAMIFDEPFIDQIFKALRSKNIAMIIGLEPYGYSLKLKSHYKFSRQYKPSVPFRKGMFIHNYPYFCERSGLSVVDECYLTPMNKRNDETGLNALYCFVAVRDDLTQTPQE